MTDKIKDHIPTEKELVAACMLFDPEWEEARGEYQEKLLADGKRWLLVWGHVLSEVTGR